MILFGIMAQNTPIPTTRPIIIGGNTCTPTCDATAPVKNGNAADPAEPRLAQNPIFLD